MDTPAQRGRLDDLAPHRQQRDLAASSRHHAAPGGDGDRLDHGPPARASIQLVAVCRLRDVLDRPARLSLTGRLAGARCRTGGAGADRNLGQAAGPAVAVDTAASDVATRAIRRAHAACATCGGRRRLTHTARPYQTRQASNATGARLTSGRPRSTTRARATAMQAGAGLGIAPAR